MKQLLAGGEGEAGDLSKSLFEDKNLSFFFDLSEAAFFLVSRRFVLAAENSLFAGPINHKTRAGKVSKEQKQYSARGGGGGEVEAGETILLPFDRRAARASEYFMLIHEKKGAAAAAASVSSALAHSCTRVPLSWGGRAAAEDGDEK